MPESNDTPKQPGFQLAPVSGLRDGNPQPTMSSREIAKLTGKQHAHVMRDIRVTLGELLGEEGLSKFGSSYLNDQNKVQPEFMLPKRESLILVSGYDVHLRARIIDRWQELENALDAAPSFAIPQSYSEALRLAADNADRADRAEAALQIATPKADAFDLISAGTESLTFTQTAKVLGIKLATLTTWLNANRWAYRQNGSWVAYRQHIENGRLEYKEAKYTDQKTGMACCRPYCHITPKGLAKLATIFGSSQKNAA